MREFSASLLELSPTSERDNTQLSHEPRWSIMLWVLLSRCFCNTIAVLLSESIRFVIRHASYSKFTSRLEKAGQSEPSRLKRDSNG